ncbi:MAG TPA: hypothetical protein GX501_08320 [Clostridiaceae bacterium]|nr:hypothetical protein [Clostridiaceae bacterium]
MNGAEKIKEKIIADARERAEKILEDARLEAQGIIKDAEKQAFQRMAIMTEKAKEDAALYKQRARAAAEMEIRKSLLKTRQDTIDEAFAAALDRIAELPDDKYSGFIEDILLRAARDGEGELVVNKKDKQRLGQQFIDRINARFISLGRNAKLKLSSDDLDSRGGFIIRYGEMEINSTLEVILNMERPNLEAGVAAILFGGE